MTARILVVEDDDTIGQNLVRTLQAEGWTAQRASTGAQAESLSASGTFDLVLLDLALPDADGVDLCPILRASNPGATMVILTARSEEIDVVVGLDAGADDYLTKPFRLAELLARLRAHLRRSQIPTGSATNGAVITAGDVSVDLLGRRVYCQDKEIIMRPKEFDLLAYLVGSAGEALTRDRLMSEVWDEHWWGPTKTLDIHISTLRRKLGEEPGSTSRITTLRGVGYRFEPR